VLGTGIVEADVAELQRTVGHDVAHGIDRRDDARVGFEHLLDAIGDTEARGIIEIMKVAITTDIRSARDT